MRAVLLVVLAGCLTSEPPPPSTAAACPLLESQTFSSVNQLECGLGPSGPTACAWRITFAPDGPTSTSFTWSYSDVSESGSVQCTGDTVASSRYHGTYDASAHTLVWEAETYLPN